jgi:hypothetical protein
MYIYHTIVAHWRTIYTSLATPTACTKSLQKGGFMAI